MHRRVYFPNCARMALLAAVGAAVLSPLSANAAPISVAPIGAVAAPKIENAYWATSCYWIHTRYGREERCHQVWVPGPYGYPYPYPYYPYPHPPHLLPPPPPHWWW